MEKAINREQDNYRFVTDSETELLQEVQEMEQNSRWLPGVPSKKIHVLPLEPIEVPIVVQKIFATLSSDEFKKTAAAKKNLCGCRSNWRLEAKKSPVVPGK